MKKVITYLIFFLCLIWCLGLFGIYIYCYCFNALTKEKTEYLLGLSILFGFGTALMTQYIWENE